MNPKLLNHIKPTNVSWTQLLAGDDEFKLELLHKLISSGFEIIPTEHGFEVYGRVTIKFTKSSEDIELCVFQS